MAKFEKVDEDLDDDDDPDTRKSISGIDKKKVKSFLTTMPKKIVANEKFLRDSSKDPFLQYGFGLIAYRSLLETLIIGYFILSCMMYPVSQIYARGGGYGRLFESDQDSYAKWSLGNLGYSSV